jgi:DNA topoisomerase-1
VSVQKTDKFLVIVESPTKVKTISKILKAAGYSKAVVIASVGHLAKLADGGPAYNSGIYPKQNFKANIIVAEDKQKIVSEITNAAKAVDKIILMSDGDRAGEWIAYSVIKFCKLPKERCYRAITHEITAKAVIHAIENPVAFNDNLANAELTRTMIDKLIGYSMSPVAKKYIGAKSVGRCQSVGLKLVSDRENEILDFIPEQYFNLYLNFTKNDTAYKAKYVGYKTEKISKFTKRADVEAVVSNCKNSPFCIESVKTVEHQESPKPPFCTATFQQEAANRIGLKVKDAMSCAQKLFEAGKITYHRTDSTELAPEFIPELQTFITNTYGADRYACPRKSKLKNTDQNGHEALRVTDPSVTPDMFAASSSNNLLGKVYKLIWQRTVASAMSSAIISETIYTINNNDHRFTLSSKNLLTAGYKEAYEFENNQAFENKLPFSENEVLENTKLDVEQLFTTPPSRYTEASLVRELQKLEIGRPSTFATIVETVLSPSRGYAKLEEKYIVPTDRGMQLADYCNRSFPMLINLNYTKEMEERLDKIADGTINWLDYMELFYNNLKDIIYKTTEMGIAPEMPEKTCHECGKLMIVRRSRFGKLFYGCSDYPRCRHTESFW